MNDDETIQKKQLVIPTVKKAEVLPQLHDRTGGGHLLVTKTLENVRAGSCGSTYENMSTTGAASNGPQRRPKVPMQQYNVESTSL